MEPKRQIDGVYSSRPRPIGTGQVPQTIARPAGKKHTLNRRPIFILIFALVVVGLVIGMHNMLGGSTSLVPQNIQKSVDFSVYYPDIKSLPAGYTLDTKSFQLAQPGVVVYSVTHQDGRLIFSEEQQPDSSVIGKFITSYIPLHSELKTDLGQAELGAYGTGKNLRTVISLPVNDGPWLILTAPSDANHDDLLQIIKSLTR